MSLRHFLHPKRKVRGLRLDTNMTIVYSFPRRSVQHLASCLWLHAASPTTTPPSQCSLDPPHFLRNTRCASTNFQRGSIDSSDVFDYFHPVTDSPPLLQLTNLYHCRYGSLGAKRTGSRNTTVQVPDPLPRKLVGKAGRRLPPDVGLKFAYLPILV